MNDIKKSPAAFTAGNKRKNYRGEADGLSPSEYGGG